MATFEDFPIVRDYDATQHEDWNRVTLTYSIDGTPVNLTGWSAEFVIFDDAGNKQTSSTSPTGVVLGGAAGTIIPKLTHTQTAALEPTSYRYALWLINASGERLPFQVGRFNVRRGITA